MPELDPMKRRLTWTVYATPLMTLTTNLGLSIRVSMFEYVRLVTGTSSVLLFLSSQSRPFVEFAILYAYQIVANVEEFFSQVRSAFALRLYHSHFPQFQDSDHCPGRHEIGHEIFFSLKSDKDSGCSSGISPPPLSGLRTGKNLKNLRSDNDLRFCEKNVWKTSDFRLNQENRLKKWIGDR